MAIGKEQLRDVFKSAQPKGSEIRDLRIKTRDGQEKDFEELIIIMDVPIAVPSGEKPSQ